MEGHPLRDAFDRLRNALDRAGLAYAVTGSWASGAYGEPRYANDLDLVVTDLDERRARRFFRGLGPRFYVDKDDAADSVREESPFNVLYLPLTYRFHIFPASGPPLAGAEIRRARLMSLPGLSSAPIPVVCAEDVILAKLEWYRWSGEAGSQHWRDLQSILRGEAERLDTAYLLSEAARLGLSDLCARACAEAQSPAG